MILSAIPPEIVSAAAGSGFNAVLVLILLYFGRGELRRMASALDRNSRSINNFVLGSMLPEVFKKHSQAIIREIDLVEQKTNDSTDYRG